MSGPAFEMVVAHLFRRSGRETLSENEFANAASLDLRWFSPKDARTLVAGLVRSGHLDRESDGRLRPAFDPDQIDVPLTFRPPSDLHTKLPPAGTFAPRGAPMAREGTAHAAARPTGAADLPSSGVVPPATDVPSAAPPKAAPINAPPTERVAPATPDAGGVPTTVQTILEALAATSGEAVPVWVQRMNRTVQDCGDLLAPEAALLLAAAREGVDVAAWGRPVHAALAARRVKRTPRGTAPAGSP